MTASVKLATLGNMEQAQSTEMLTSLINAYKLSLDEVLPTIDKIIAMDNAAATSAEEIGTALQRTASTASMAGVGFDELAAQITVVSSVSRLSAETIGTAFRSIYTRMQDVKLGKEFDEDGESISNVEEVLKGLDIQLRESDLTFRDFSDVMDEVMAKWKELAEQGRNVEMAALVKAFAGTRQGDIFRVLLNNQEMYVDMLEEEANALGTTNERYKIYSDGVEAANKRMTASWERLWEKSLNSKSIKLVYDLGSAFLDLITAMGGLLPVVALLAGALVMLNFTSVVKGIEGAMAALVAMKGVMVGFATATAAQMAVATAGVTLLVGAIVAIGIALAQGADHAEKYAQAMQKVTESTEKVARTRDNISSLEKLGERYRELNSILQRSAEEEREWLDVQNQIKAILPSINGSYDDLGNYRITEIGDLESLIQLKKDQLAIDIKQIEINKQLQIDAKKEQLDAAVKKAQRMEEFYGMSEKDRDSVQKLYGLSDEEMASGRETQQAAIKDQSMLIEELRLEYEELTLSIDGNSSAVEDNARVIAEDAVSLDQLKNAAKESSDAFFESNSLLESVMADYDKYGQITVEQAYKMIEAGYASAIAIDQETGAITLNAAETRRMAIEKANAAAADAQAAYAASASVNAHSQETRALWAKWQALASIANILGRTANTATIPTSFAPSSGGGGGGKSPAQKEAEENLKRIKDEKNAEKEALKDKLDAFKKIIDAKKKILDQYKEEQKYQKALQDKQKDLSKIEEELLQIQFDDSEEARAKRLLLEEERAEKIEEIDEFQNDRAVELQKDALDEQYAQYKEHIDAQMDALDDYLKDLESRTKAYLDSLGSATGGFYNSLTNWNQAAGTSIDHLINKYNILFQQIMAAKIAVNDRAAFNMIDRALGTSTGTTSSVPKRLDSDLPAWPSYHTGGIVGGLPTTKEGEILAKLLPGEVVANEGDARNFINKTLPSLINASSGGVQVAMEFNIAGDLDRSVLPQIQDSVMETINKAMGARGIRRNANSFSI